MWCAWIPTHACEPRNAKTGRLQEGAYCLLIHSPRCIVEYHGFFFFFYFRRHISSKFATNKGEALIGGSPSISIAVVTITTGFVQVMHVHKRPPDPFAPVHRRVPLFPPCHFQTRCYLTRNRMADLLSTA